MKLTAPSELSLVLALATTVSQTFARPLEGAGGMMVQPGGSRPLLDMHYEHFPSFLEETATKDAEENKSATEAEEDQSSSGEVATANMLPEIQQEDIIIVEVETAPIIDIRPDMIMSGLLNMLTPQRISPPSPIEEAVHAAEEIIQELVNTLQEEAAIDIEFEINPPMTGTMEMPGIFPMFGL